MAVLVALVTVMFGALAMSGAFGATTGEIVTYVSTVTIPVPPASNYAGSGGGDGWDISLSATQVFNVFHHSNTYTVACHEQSDASACYSPRTITDAGGHNFASPSHSTTYFDLNTGHLYGYGVRDDNTAGVVCVDTTVAATNTNPFCGFTALGGVGDAQISGGGGSTSLGMVVGSRFYSFQYANATPSGTQDKLLCFDINAVGPCAGQPYSVDIGAGAVSVSTYPWPATAQIGADLIIPINTGGTDRIACFNTSSGASCGGSFPIDASTNGTGAPFERLDASGNIVGFCLATTGVPCFDLSGASTPTPAGITSVITPTQAWNGKTFTIGSRVYLANGSTTEVQCFDYSSGATCPNFPHATPGAGYIYSVSRDWQRPTCMWLNADYGTSQIQSFDAFSGGACGEGAIRVLLSQLVVPQEICTPTTYQSIDVVEPARDTYTSGTVGFATFNGNATGIADQPIDANGSVNLTGLGLESVDRPQFLLALNGGSASQVVVRLTYQAQFDESCVAANVVVQQPTEVVQPPIVIAPKFTG